MTAVAAPLVCATVDKAVVVCRGCRIHSASSGGASSFQAEAPCVWSPRKLTSAKVRQHLQVKCPKTAGSESAGWEPAVAVMKLLRTELYTSTTGSLPLFGTDSVQGACCKFFEPRCLMLFIAILLVTTRPGQLG